MDSDLDTVLLERISSFEKELLTPLVDRSSLVVFNRRWTSLNNDLQVALKANALKSSTITVAYSLADRVARMIKTFMDLETLAEKLMTSLLDETSFMQDLLPTTHSSTFSDTTLPPYIKPSHDWLVENIHNPYPSVTVRDTIAQKSGSVRKDIDNWFKDARKRIGWNDARKTYFSNKRADIVDAAMRFYANDEKLSLSQGAEHALISIMKNAKDLYCNKFDETILASKLASVVKDLTPATKVEAKAERLRQARLRKDRDCYPSPDRSPEPPQPSLVPCDDEVDTQPISSRKRRNMSVEPVDSDRGEECRRKKRSRLDASSSSPGVSFTVGLPSPAPSINEPLQAIEATTAPSLPSPASVSTSRKRRLSESDGQVIPKRPRHLPAGPRSQIVSDSLPISNNLLFDETSFDGWFQQIFDRPETGEMNPCGFSVELGTLSDFDCETPIESRSTLPEFSEQAQTLEPPTSEVAEIPTVLNIPWNDFDFGWTDNSSLSSANVRQSNSLLNFVGQEPLPKPLAQDLVNFTVSSHVSRPSNEFESFFGLSSPSIVDPVAISLNPASTETWNFSESAINRNDIFGKHNVDFASNNALLASLDFSQGTDFLPSRSGISLPTLPQDKARQEKEKEFREAYEKAQRLALELQKDDLFPL